MPKDHSHYAYIDALRGLAILGVFFFHVGNRTPGIPKLLSLFSNNGNYGVQLFYVASALTLCMSWYRKSSVDIHPIKSFALRRLFRIAPMFYCGILFYTLIFGMGARGTAIYSIDWRHILTTTLFLHGWHPTTINSVVPGGWSIAVEMTFYLCLPWLAGHIKSLKKSVYLFLALLLSASALKWMALWFFRQYSGFPEHLLHRYLYYWFPYQLPVFMLGFVLYYLILSHTDGLFRNRPGWNRLPKKAEGCFFIWSGAFLFIFAALATPPNSHIVNSISYLLLAYGLHLYPHRLLVNKMTCHIGKISFSAYLTHFFILDKTNLFLNSSFGKIAFPSPWAQYIALSLIGLIGTVALSAITYTLIERPGMIIGANLSKKLNALPGRTMQEQNRGGILRSGFPLNTET